MKNLALIGTYPPRECGIATFSHDVYNSIINADSKCQVIAIDDGLDSYDYPSEVSGHILAKDKIQYNKLATELNHQKLDAVYIQHEFGIYGGEHGEFLLDLIINLNHPIIVTMHTVLDTPDIKQKNIIQTIAQYSSHIIVMSHKGKGLLQTIYNIPANRIKVIPHGIPDRPFGHSPQYKKTLGLREENILMTFGLLGPGKGLENMIDALPEIIKIHPNTCYYILGTTHPHYFKHSGQNYQNKLMEQAKLLGVDKHVKMIHEFIPFDLLLDYIAAADIYVTPYLSEKQITSGTLSYAAGMGKVIVSTPYWHAQELLANNRGILTPFDDTKSLSTNINQLLENPTLRANIAKNAYQHCRSMTWDHSGKHYLALLNSINPPLEDPITDSKHTDTESSQPINIKLNQLSDDNNHVFSYENISSKQKLHDLLSRHEIESNDEIEAMRDRDEPQSQFSNNLNTSSIISGSLTNKDWDTYEPFADEPPVISLTHLSAMTDDTGLLQHATYNIPNRQHGYTIDDNSRALMFVAELQGLYPELQSDLRELTSAYLSFIQFAYDAEQKRFHNFMSFDRKWLDYSGSEDSQARTLLALATAASKCNNHGHQQCADELFQRSALSICTSLQSTRAQATAIQAIDIHLSYYNNPKLKTAMQMMAASLAIAIENNSEDWPWPEDSLTYENACIPTGLMIAGRRLGNQTFIVQGIRSLSFITEMQFPHGLDGCLIPIGNQGWAHKNGQRAVFDQQPLEATAMMKACLTAYELTSPEASKTKHNWLIYSEKCLNWFLGENLGYQALAIPENGSCFDGLQADNVNYNQGAESTLAWLEGCVLAHGYKLLINLNSDVGTQKENPK